MCIKLQVNFYHRRWHITCLPLKSFLAHAYPPRFFSYKAFIDACLVLFIKV
jgi:hypothetical protein